MEGEIGSGRCGGGFHLRRPGVLGRPDPGGRVGRCVERVDRCVRALPGGGPGGSPGGICGGQSRSPRKARGGEGHGGHRTPFGCPRPGPGDRQGGNPDQCPCRRRGRPTADGRELDCPSVGRPRRHRGVGPPRLDPPG
ncbi:MAG: hypothetical protein F4Z41_00655 [Acidimicrobiia bacterium]|nr:hypothetical protein [Acidimicrobiia bacterium]MYB77979.1 hypothetical protein [Acidimicrobiia bacterium]MYK56189.1 hypothetical protein [Acidimicrobiia bacterium]